MGGETSIIRTGSVFKKIAERRERLDKPRQRGVFLAGREGQARRKVSQAESLLGAARQAANFGRAGAGGGGAGSVLFEEEKQRRRKRQLG